MSLRICAPQSLRNNRQESVSSSFVQDFRRRNSASSAVFVNLSGICSSMISRWDSGIFGLGLIFCFFLQRAIFTAPAEDVLLSSPGLEEARMLVLICCNTALVVAAGTLARLSRTATSCSLAFLSRRWLPWSCRGIDCPTRFPVDLRVEILALQSLFAQASR